MIYGKLGFIGLFLIMMGIAMLFMCLTYYKTKKMQVAWMVFGGIYTLGLLLLMTNNPIKVYLNIPESHQFYSIPSLIILMIGIMLSFILFQNKGEKYVISSILFVVGIHFLPFQTIYTYILAIAVILNALYSFLKKEHSIYITLLTDAFIKIIMGFILLFIK